MRIQVAKANAHQHRNPAFRVLRTRITRAFLALLLIGTAGAPLRAATLNEGFSPLSLIKGAKPVPRGCGRPLAACTCCAQATDAEMNPEMGMDMNMAMSSAIIDPNARLDGPGLNASPNQLTVTNAGASAYSINSVNNPILTFVRGQTYTFNVTANGHPFYIKTVQGNGTGNAYTNGVTGNGTQIGTVTFVVPLNAPDTLFYDCGIHAAMTNRIDVISAVPEPSTWALLGVGAIGMGLLAKRRSLL